MNKSETTPTLDLLNRFGKWAMQQTPEKIEAVMREQFNPMGDAPYPAMRFVGYSIAMFLLGICVRGLFQ